MVLEWNKCIQWFTQILMLYILNFWDAWCLLSLVCTHIKENLSALDSFPSIFEKSLNITIHTVYIWIRIQLNLDNTGFSNNIRIIIQVFFKTSIPCREVFYYWLIPSFCGFLLYLNFNQWIRVLEHSRTFYRNSWNREVWLTDKFRIFWNDPEHCLKRISLI